MPPAEDDQEIPDAAVLLRVLPAKWVTTKGGRERPTSDSMLDSNFENSCFIDGEIGEAELRTLFPECKIARIAASVVRREGYAIERRPTESPEHCSNPRAHVVTGPISPLDRGAYERAARQIVKDPSIQIMLPPESVDA